MKTCPCHKPCTSTWWETIAPQATCLMVSKEKLTCRLGGGYSPDPSSFFHSWDTASPALCTKASIRIISWVSTPLQDTRSLNKIIHHNCLMGLHNTKGQTQLEQNHQSQSSYGSPQHYRTDAVGTKSSSISSHGSPQHYRMNKIIKS